MLRCYLSPLSDAAPTVHFVSLGCPKNRVDTEVMLGHTADAGYQVVSDPAAAEVIVVNTCGFIGEAKQESIDAILEMATLQGERVAAASLVVAGCLTQRYPKELAEELPEVDHFLGTDEVALVADAIAGRTERLHVAETPRYLYDDLQPRRPSMALHTAYVKIAEGCDRPCAFCIIPKLRGPQRSRDPESVVREAQDLVARGARELCLVAQDLTTYGRDLPDGRDDDGPNLERLLAHAGPGGRRALDPPALRLPDGGHRRAAGGDGARAGGGQVPGRAHPARRRRRAEVDAPRPRLQRGARPGRAGAHPGARASPCARPSSSAIPARPRRRSPSCATSCARPSWTGWACSTTRARRARWRRCCPSASRQKEIDARRRELLRIQRQVSKKKMKALRGREIEVLVEGPSDESEYVLMGRHEGQAPEIDGQVYLTLDADFTPAAGTFVRARVTNSAEYDLAAECWAPPSPLSGAPQSAQGRRASRYRSRASSPLHGPLAPAAGVKVSVRGPVPATRYDASSIIRSASRARRPPGRLPAR